MILSFGCTNNLVSLLEKASGSFANVVQVQIHMVSNIGSTTKNKRVDNYFSDPDEIIQRGTDLV